MNKQVKILENKISQLEKESKELMERCDNRLESLARNDGIYQNFQGQIIEKQKRLIDMREFLQMIGNVKSEETKPKDEKPKRSRADKQSKSDEKSKGTNKVD